MPDPLVKFRRVHLGNGQRCYIPATIAVADADDSHNNAVEDLYVGGVTMMQVVSYHQDATHGDYLVCQPPGDPEVVPTVKVAVEPQLQSAITAETNPDSTTWHYSTYSASGQSRLRTDDSVTEYIDPPFISTNIVPVWTCGNTGVTVSSVAVTLIAITGRQWAEAAS